VAKVAVPLQCHAGARPVQEDDGHGGLHQLTIDKLKEQLHKAQCEPVATAASGYSLIRAWRIPAPAPGCMARAASVRAVNT
jgi:hypothetical protein